MRSWRKDGREERGGGREERYIEREEANKQTNKGRKKDEREVVGVVVVLGWNGWLRRRWKSSNILPPMHPLIHPLGTATTLQCLPACLPCPAQPCPALPPSPRIPHLASLFLSLLCVLMCVCVCVRVFPYLSILLPPQLPSLIYFLPPQLANELLPFPSLYLRLAFTRCSLVPIPQLSNPSNPLPRFCFLCSIPLFNPSLWRRYSFTRHPFYRSLHNSHPPKFRKSETHGYMNARFFGFCHSIFYCSLCCYCIFCISLFRNFHCIQLVIYFFIYLNQIT